MANHASADQPALVWWIRIAFLFLWATLLVHEGAHYLMARLLFSPSDWAGNRRSSPDPRQVSTRRYPDPRGLRQLRQEVVIALARVPPHHAAQRRTLKGFNVSDQAVNKAQDLLVVADYENDRNRGVLSPVRVCLRSVAVQANGDRRPTH